VIVRAGAERLDDVRPLFLHLRDHHHAGDPQIGPKRGDEEAWAVVRPLIAEALAEEGSFLLFAERPGEPPDGYALVTIQGPMATWAVDRYGMLDELSVAPTARGLGLGARLVEAVQQALADEGVDVLELSAMAGNLGAQAFYRALGFTVSGVELRRTRTP
jgi:ribosomal protein S18 acetylase RimI-like enzyme